MHPIAKLIKNTGLEKFTHEKLEAKGFMPLCIEQIGNGPRGLPLFSMAHYGEQNGDLMKDPDVTAELDAEFKFYPISFQNDYFGLYQEAVFQRDGKTMIRPKLVKELSSFLRTWGANLRQQGFFA